MEIGESGRRVRITTSTWLAWALVAGIGAIAGWALAFRPAPEVGGAVDDAAVTVPTTSTSFADERRIELALGSESPTSLRSNLSGTVTRLTCSVGESWVSGESPVAVDGRPLLALATTSPLYRDLTGGETGEDVAALQETLVELGYPVPPSGSYDAETRSAVAGVLQTIGVETQDGSLRREDVVWLPISPAVLTACDRQLGDVIAAGDPVATTGAVSSVTYPIPADLIEGDRQIVVDTEVFPVADLGLMEDPSEIARLLLMPSAEVARGLAASSGEPALVPARLVLSDPLEVSGVPPSALAGLIGDRACVLSDGEGFPVSVVASSLGVSYVVFDGEPPTQVQVNPGDVQCS